jgi:hypothetical protein
MIASDLLTLVGLVCLLWLMTSAFPNLKVASFRSQLFEVRERLWRQAAEHGFLGSEAYRILRLRINRTIRYAERISTFRVLFFIAVHRLYGLPGPMDPLDAMIQSRPRQEREILMRAEADVQRLTARYVFTPVFMALATSWAKMPTSSTKEPEARFAHWADAHVDAMESISDCPADRSIASAKA